MYTLGINLLILNIITWKKQGPFLSRKNLGQKKNFWAMVSISLSFSFESSVFLNLDVKTPSL